MPTSHWTSVGALRMPSLLSEPTAQAFTGTGSLFRWSWMGRAVLMSLLLSQRKAGPRRIRNRKEICVGKRNFIHILPRGMYRLTLVRRASLPVTDSKTQTKKGRPKGRASSMSLLQSPRKADPRRRRSRREELILWRGGGGGFLPLGFLYSVNTAAGLSLSSIQENFNPVNVLPKPNHCQSWPVWCRYVWFCCDRFSASNSKDQSTHSLIASLAFVELECIPFDYIHLVELLGITEWIRTLVLRCYKVKLFFDLFI